MAQYKIGDTIDLGNCTACGNVIAIEPDNALFRPQRCGNPVKLKDEKWLCGSCLRKIRMKYPQEYRMDPVQHLMQPFERSSELTSDEAIRELSQIHTYLEDLREKYSFHQAVFAVEKVDVTKAGFLKPPFITVTGHVVYGTFYSLDDVTVGLNGGQTARINCLYEPQSRKPVSDLEIRSKRNSLLIDYSWADGGEEIAFIFQDKSLKLNPGDFLVK